MAEHSPDAETLPQLQALAAQALDVARQQGASGADVVVQRAHDFEVKVADGKIVTLSQAVRVELGLRAFVDGRLGFCAATDVTPDGLRRGVAAAIAMAKITARDPYHGLATADAMASNDDSGSRGPAASLDLYDDRVAALSGATKVAMAHEIEQAAREADRRVQKFRDSGVSSEVLHEIYACSDGRAFPRSSTNVSAWCTPVAQAGDELQTDFWFDSQCHLRDLQNLPALGAQAAARAVRMLGARRVATQKVPVVFEAPAAAQLLGSMLAALDGDMVHRRASFLADKLGQQIAASALHLRDEPHLWRGVGSRWTDGEGLPTRPRALLDGGRLATFLYDGYSARRANVAPTASAQRSAAGLPHAGAFNVRVLPGTCREADILRAAPRALLVTRGLGRGLNTVSGEYSRGVSGLWLEHGEVVHPVQEATVAGDFLTMLQGIDAIGDEVLTRGKVAAPMLRVREMAVGGS